MAEYRPYRMVDEAARWQLHRFKLVIFTAFVALSLLINWFITERVAQLLGRGPGLGATLMFGLHDPWDWALWWYRWRDAEDLQLLWNSCLHTAAYGMAIIGGATGVALIIGRMWIMRKEVPDLHGSARWANTADVVAAGFLSRKPLLPASLRKPLVRFGLLRERVRQHGIYLGAWGRGGKRHLLRDCGPGHVLIEAPTRAGKGVNSIIPTLLTWPHSVLIFDLKGENWELTSGARSAMGQLCLKFDPTDTTGTTVKYNPLEQVRLRTVFEAEDVQNIVHMIVDPDGAGLNDHWVKTGAALLTGTILHLLYAERNKTLRGLVSLLSDPQCSLGETIGRMLLAEHDPGGQMGWHDANGAATRTHPIVAESMRELLNKSENERAGVFSTVMSFLALYRDPIIEANTAYSEFKLDDLVNHEKPLSLYLVVPMSSRDRLRPLVRLMLNQIVRTLTTTLDYRDGRAVSANKHPLLLLLDEFTMLGRLEILAEALSLIAGYGIRTFLAVQNMDQIYNLYGPRETIIANCDTTVRFTPNNLTTAEQISRLCGQASVRHEHRTQAGSRADSISEPEIRRELITVDEARRMSPDDVLIFARGQRPIRARLFKYYEASFFKQRASIKAPVTSDRPRQPAVPEMAVNPAVPAAVPPTIPPSQTGTKAQQRLLKFARKPSEEQP
jgi:type IV secretion system protein VirD4